VSALALATVGAAGVYLLYTAALARFWPTDAPPASHDRAPAMPTRRSSMARIGRDWLSQAGLGEVGPVEFTGVIAGLFLAGAALGVLLFGSPVPALIIGGFAAGVPIAAFRQRRVRRRQRARESWPRMIEEIRIRTGSAGRSIPQALFEVGGAGPEELRPAFESARREWLLSTDFERTLAVLKAQLADPTADVTCETLLVAHQLGGSDLDRRLEALAEDRRQDVQDRKDATAKQAGARFARRFVLVVPLGMALVGLSIGDGRAAYETALGQIVVVAALAMIVVCWWWAGRIMRLPDEERVFG
jgi:tight adherence protein B